MYTKCKISILPIPWWCLMFTSIIEKWFPSNLSTVNFTRYTHYSIGRQSMKVFDHNSHTQIIQLISSTSPFNIEITRTTNWILTKQDIIICTWINSDPSFVYRQIMRSPVVDYTVILQIQFVEAEAYRTHILYIIIIYL